MGQAKMVEQGLKEVTITYTNAFYIQMASKKKFDTLIEKRDIEVDEWSKYQYDEELKKLEALHNIMVYEQNKKVPNLHHYMDGVKGFKMDIDVEGAKHIYGVLTWMATNSDDIFSDHYKSIAEEMNQITESFYSYIEMPFS